MAALSNSLVISNSLGCSLKSVEQRIPNLGPANLSFSLKGSRRASCSKRALSVQARQSDGGKSSDADIFISGFFWGGLVVGTLTCVYANQISKALSGIDRKEIMKKLPKFINDGEKVMEKQRATPDTVEEG